MATNIPINIPVNTNAGTQVNQFKQLKNSLREAIGQLAGLTEGTEAFNAQAARVGQLRDQISDLNATVASVSGSPIENLSGSFGLLSGQVSSLDFDGATTSLSGFAGQIKNFSFKDLIAGAKSFTSTLGSLGKALLSNPIFIIGGVIVALGVAIYKLKDSVKVIGDAFAFFGDIIDGVVQAGKDFLDFIGATNFATEEKAAKTIEAAKAEEAAITDRYDKEIKIAQSAGKDTAKIEEAKRQAILGTIKAQVDALKTLREVNGEYTEDQLKQLKELTKKFNDIETEKTVNDNKRIEEKKKTNKAAYDAQLAANKQLNKQIEDTNIATTKDEEYRALLKIDKDRERRNKDIEDSKASAAVKNQALLASEKQFQSDVAASTKAFDDKRIAEEKATQEKLKAEKQAAVDFVNRDIIAGAELNAVKNENDINAQIELLETKKNIELENKALTDNEKLLLEQNYINAVSKLKQDEATKSKELRDQERAHTLETAQNVTNSLSSLSDAFFTIKKNNLQKGSKEEEAAAKKQFQVNKALALSTAIITGIQSVMAAYANGMKNPIPLLGPATGAIYAVIAGVTAAANVAKIASQTYSSSGSAGSASGSVGGGAQSVSAGSASSAPVSSKFSAETIGQAGSQDGNNANGQRQANSQRVYVLESDITNTQKKVQTIESQATIG